MGQFYQRRRIGIMLASLCVLLGVAASASAECAWVLWANGPKAGYYWKPVRAWKTADECEFDRRMTFEKKNVPPDVELTCLPDTVDPRGPK